MRTRLLRIAICWVGLVVPLACIAQLVQRPEYRWTKFVQVDGQPDPVPAEWVATPEGKFAHSLEIPNAVPRDSGYRRGMSSKEYFEHLCMREAGEFIFSKVDNVEGLLFMRPPRSPTDADLMDRYRLEAPDFERTFQLIEPTPQGRGRIFVNPPWRLYSFVDEPYVTGDATSTFVRASGYRQKTAQMKIDRLANVETKYALTWRGIKRPNDRDHAIAGSEWIVIDRATRAVMAVHRDYVRTGETPNTPQGIWWLNAVNCPGSSSRNMRSKRIYDFASRVLQPRIGGQDEQSYRDLVRIPSMSNGVGVLP